MSTLEWLFSDRDIPPMLARLMAALLALCCLMIWAQQTPRADAAQKNQIEHCVTQCVADR